MADETRTLLIIGDKNFKITIPADAKVTFAPFSPPNSNRETWRTDGRAVGTIRIYGKTKDNILAVFSDVRGFRDLSIGYAEEVAREEGAVIWKDDEQGYTREEKIQRSQDWIDDPARQIQPPPRKRAVRKKT